MGRNTAVDLLRNYTIPRAFAFALLFSLSAIVRVPTIVIAVVQVAVERLSDHLLAWANAIPAQPARSRTARGGQTR